MTGPLPPLNALRAFEAASRTLSFTRAAEELCLTPAAVSHQIKTLEERLGIALFRRENNRIFLTDRGQAYLPVVRDGLHMIAEATSQIGVEDASRVLNLSVLPTFAVRWLIPRIAEFQKAHPRIDLRFSTTERPVDFKREGYDAAVRYGSGRWNDLCADPLFNEELVVVCSPRLLSEAGTPERPEDLERFTLLHSATCPDNWRRWLSAVEARNVDPVSGLRFESCMTAMQATFSGLGFMAANFQYVKEDLSNGLLVAPFEFSLKNPRAWYYVYPKSSAGQPMISALGNWLAAQAARRDAINGQPFEPQSLDGAAL